MVDTLDIPDRAGTATPLLLRGRIQVSSLDAACRVVAAGLGLAVLPREATAPHAQASGLVLVPLDEAWAVRRFAICSRPPAQLSASAKRRVEHLARLAAGG